MRTANTLHIPMYLRPSTRVRAVADELLVMHNLAAANCVQEALIAPGKREQNWEEAYDGALGISDHWMMLRGMRI